MRKIPHAISLRERGVPSARVYDHHVVEEGKPTQNNSRCNKVAKYMGNMLY